MIYNILVFANNYVFILHISHVKKEYPESARAIFPDHFVMILNDSIEVKCPYSLEIQGGVNMNR